MLDAPAFGIHKAERLIIDCTYMLDENGTITEMTLMHRDAFNEPADDTLDDVKGSKGKDGGKKGKSKKAKKSSKDNVTEFSDFVE